jgi:hypothetical protein
VLKYPWAFLLKVLLAAGLAWLAIWPLPDGTWLWLMAQTAVFGAVLMGVLLVLKPLSTEDHALLARLMPMMTRVVARFVPARARGEMA